MCTCKVMDVHAVCSSPFLHTLLVFWFAMDVVSNLHLLDSLGLLVEPFA